MASPDPDPTFPEPPSPSMTPPPGGLVDSSLCMLRLELGFEYVFDGWRKLEEMALMEILFLILRRRRDRRLLRMVGVFWW